jgi:aminoglycoside 3-N-acetyltransferase
MKINYTDIAKALPLKDDDILLIVSDVKRMASHEIEQHGRFDANVFIDSFKAQLSEGTLLFHAFSDHLVSGDTFHYKKTRPNTGALSVAAWKDRDFVRTQDPFHSFMVWGKGSDLLRQTDSVSTFGKDSVFGWMHRNHAKMLFIDTPLINSFTFVHYCEETVTVPYRKHVKHRIRFIGDNNEEVIKEKLFYTRKSGYYNDLDGLEEALELEGIMYVLPFNGITFKLMDLSRAFDFIRQNILHGKASLLHGFSSKQYVKDVLRKAYRTFHPKKPAL